MHIHISLAHALMTFIEVMLALIPFKFLCAQFAGRSNLASAGFAVL